MEVESLIDAGAWAGPVTGVDEEAAELRQRARRFTEELQTTPGRWIQGWIAA